ncbi:hypothetical protein K8I28_05125 [bacterium]|nr:hypothetical protein [bacterium]
MLPKPNISMLGRTRTEEEWAQEIYEKVKNEAPNNDDWYEEFVAGAPYPVRSLVLKMLTDDATKVVEEEQWEDPFLTPVKFTS